MCNNKNNSTDAILIAEIIHEKLCLFNHTDGCGWFYEKWDGVDTNPEYYKLNRTRDRYYKMSLRLIENGFTLEMIQKIFKIIKDNKV